MSYPSQPRAVPYGMATMPTGAAVPGMPGVAGMQGVTGMPSVAGMTAVPAGMARVPNGIGGLYQTEKPATLYPTYHSLGQPGYLAQASPAAGQASFLGATQSGYLTASSPTSQQRYMVSPTYPGTGALVSSPSMLAGAQGYSLAAPGGGAYALSTQPSTLSMTQTVPVATSSLSSQTQNPYPTYISSQLGPVQISPSQNPYAAAATGHPLYPASHLAGLQVQPSQLQPGQQIPGRGGQVYSATTGLPLGYPAHATSPGSFYPTY